jgi:hypothetical protein
LARRLRPAGADGGEHPVQIEDLITASGDLLTTHVHLPAAPGLNHAEPQRDRTRNHLVAVVRLGAPLEPNAVDEGAVRRCEGATVIVRDP